MKHKRLFLIVLLQLCFRFLPAAQWRYATRVVASFLTKDVLHTRASRARYSTTGHSCAWIVATVFVIPTGPNRRT